MATLSPSRAAPAAAQALPPRFPAVGLARAELRMGLRSSVFRFMALAALVLGWAVGGTTGWGVAFSAYSAGEAAWEYFGFVAIIWMSLAAARESTLGTAALVYSKPQPTERLVLAKFAGLFGQVLVALAALFVGAAIGRLVHGDGLTGASAYVLQYVRAAGVLLFACAASYSLALLAESAVAGALIALYWVATMAGKEYLAKVYFPAYSQNLPAYVCFGLALLAVAMWAYRRSRRGGVSAAAWVRLAVPACAAIGGFLLWAQIRGGSDPMIRMDPTMDRIGQQSVDMGRRAPGFLLPDQHGRLTGLSDYPGRILLVAIWAPKDAESSYLLDTLGRLHAKYGARGVQPVAVCVSEDQGAAATFARGEGVDFPVVSDWATHNAPRLAEASPVASAYQVSPPPVVIVTDRRRRVRDRLEGAGAYDYRSLEGAVLQRLAEEPK